MTEETRSGLRTNIVQFEKEMSDFNSFRVVFKISVAFLQFWIVFNACRSLSMRFESSMVEIWLVRVLCFDLIEL